MLTSLIPQLALGSPTENDVDVSQGCQFKTEHVALLLNKVSQFTDI